MLPVVDEIPVLSPEVFYVWLAPDPTDLLGLKWKTFGINDNVKYKLIEIKV